MRNLAILLTHNHRLISAAAILDMFETVNSFYGMMQQLPVFNIQLIAPPDTPSLPDFAKYSPVSMEAAGKADVILIPAFIVEDLSPSLEANKPFIPWIQAQYQQGAEVASFCTGAFLLGATGLLNGRPATTHLMFSSAFEGYFPDVLLQRDKVLTADAGIYTSGGATSTFHLLLFLIEKYCGREMAIRAAKLFAIDMDRETQSYFSMFLPDRQHSDPLITAVQQRMEKEYQEGSNVENFLSDVPASRRNFVRRFKQATGITPIEYLQKTRIEAARKLLEQTDMPVLSVMLDCGYNDIKAFRKVFRKEVGLTPKEYRVKFNTGNRKMPQAMEI